jgi:hypothetical protein
LLRSDGGLYRKDEGQDRNNQEEVRVEVRINLEEMKATQ